MNDVGASMYHVINLNKRITLINNRWAKRVGKLEKKLDEALFLLKKQESRRWIPRV